jgi:hypothetical protein
MGTGTFSGVKRPERRVKHPPHLTPRLKKEYSYISASLWAFMTSSKAAFSNAHSPVRHRRTETTGVLFNDERNFERIQA